jgi:hypothetical protein
VLNEYLSEWTSITPDGEIPFAAAGRSICFMTCSCTMDVPSFFYTSSENRELQKKRLKAQGFNRGMNGGVARHPLLGMVRATNSL